ncbi:class I SAM-dependent methyltransferase [Solimonas marina]|uniref:Class I SAM-dependent methyltransferase n=1 Tax=Solimonas marina TaxID=2714601 RepID=A0A969W9C2_9GAMM|nr:class I SAM-dependent methyltransferase [Solimonas marina]NKF22289.1 class I SAM-dependent methyltransferase [Solimonas marina]
MPTQTAARRDAMNPENETPPEKPDYGIDAPDVVRRLLMFGSAALVLQFAMPSLVGLLPLAMKLQALSLGRSLGMAGWVFVASACVLLWGSRVGKFRLRDKLLNAMPWRGDERVLDIGCGRGLMMAGVASRLTSGRVIGIDLWRKDQQSRNAPEAALRNLRLEGYAQRVEVRTADALALPFHASSFDVVVSSWTLHNLATADDRRTAIAEIARVLRPGGRVLLIDVAQVRAYADLLRAHGFEAVQIGAPNFLFILPSRSVVGRKPG